MSHQVKQNMLIATNVLTLLGLITAGVFYFDGNNTADAKLNSDQDAKITVLQSEVAEIPHLKAKVDSQGDDIKDVRRYVEYGILPRLQLDKDELLKKAAKAEQIYETK